MLIPSTHTSMLRTFPRTVICLFLLVVAGFGISESSSIEEIPILGYTVNPQKQNVQMYWLDDQGQPLQSLERLRDFLKAKDKELLFAMNAGMYKPDHTPQGLFIQQGKEKSPLDTNTGKGNFYLLPNGVFLLTTNKEPYICPTKEFKNYRNVGYATQSGPLLLINGNIHPAFQKGSSNLNIRNGVGILPDNRILFAMSQKEINFYDFAQYFLQHGCKNALYLDGYVSRTYLPEQNWVQLDGNFGAIIGVAK